MHRRPRIDNHDFGLAIAVAVGVFGEALAEVAGPLIEVSVLVALVYSGPAFRRFSVWSRRLSR